MIKSIIHDTFILKRKSENAAKADLNTAKDLLDTLNANCERCVGMAANMIGVNKRIIAVNLGLISIVMINPVITEKSGEYETEEGCLSLDGVRKTKRYKTIEVEFLNIDFKKQKQTFSFLTAEIIQHEIDHCDGILI